MKKVYAIFSTTIILILILAIIFSTNTNKSELSLESVGGSSIYKIWEGYDMIRENSSEDFTIEAITELKENLISIEAYSNVVDNIVSEDLLQPIAANLLDINKNIEGNYKKNGELTEIDKESYTTINNEIKNILPLINKVYYIPKKEGRIRLEIKDFEELEDINIRLHDYLSKK